MNKAIRPPRKGPAALPGYAGDDAQYLTHISNCYNVGSVTAANANAMLGGIVGRSGYDSVAITNCYYLTGTAGQVYGDGKATVTNTTEKSAFDFANGGVLALLMADRPADAQPWDTTCKYLESAGMTPAGIGQAKPDRPRPCVEHLHDRHCGQDPHPQLCLRRCGDGSLHHHPGHLQGCVGLRRLRSAVRRP